MPTRLAVIGLLLMAAGRAQRQEPHAEARLRMQLVASRALALFRAADSIASSLQARGMRLRSTSTALRVRIEMVLDRAEAAIGSGDVERAAGELERAEALLARLGRETGP